MHILLVIVGLVGSIVYYLTVIKRGADAASDIADTVGGAIGKTKWWMWKKKNLKPPHELIDSPVLSATTVMYQLMRMKGDLSVEGLALLQSEMGSTLRLTSQQTEETLAEARFISQGIRDQDRFFEKQGRFLADSVSSTEFTQLQAMLADAAAVDGGASHLQQDALRRVEAARG